MTGITVTCFAASYAVALALEVTRLLFRSGIRGAVMMAFAGAGLVAHTLFLATRVMQFQSGPTSNWLEWFFLAAWILVATYLYLAYYHPKNPIGLFILPLVLALIGVGYAFRGTQSFAGEARLWGLVHGLSLLLGTVVVLIGFVAGLMYLMEASRLKRKKPPPRRLRLPSLEWAEKVNGRTIMISTILLSVGVISGLALNAIHHSRGTPALPWHDPVVWSSGLLLAWLVLAAAFNLVYRPARHGRKVAYLTMASMLFLLLALGVILLVPSQHPSQQGTTRTSEAGPAAERSKAVSILREIRVVFGNMRHLSVWERSDAVAAGRGFGVTCPLPRLRPRPLPSATANLRQAGEVTVVSRTIVSQWQQAGGPVTKLQQFSREGSQA